MKNLLVLFSVVLGIAFLIIAYIYFTHSAKTLPVFFPGHDATISKYHYKHGIGMVILGFGCFVFAWFQSGKKSVKKKEQETKNSDSATV